jgi:hypothetical protein
VEDFHYKILDLKVRHRYDFLNICIPLAPRQKPATRALIQLSLPSDPKIARLFSSRFFTIGYRRELTSFFSKHHLSHPKSALEVSLKFLTTCAALSVIKFASLHKISHF